jgi:cellulose synthase/poly-beta-1,6-N-acetylglucosamine synthase-like glycosyltransferase
MKKGLLHKQIVIFNRVIDKIIFAHVVVVGVPTILYYCLLVNGWDLLALQFLIPTCYLLTSLVVIGEATIIAFWYSSKSKLKLQRGLLQRFSRFPRIASTHSRAKLLARKHQLPRCTFIVVAYLPNEQNIILDTLKYILMNVERPQDGLEVILAYNSPVSLPVEDDLQHLANLYPELRLLCVEGSRSKAENLNAALQIITGEITCILDADHWPTAGCLRRAWRWLASDRYDVVQGRNVIRNHNCNLLTKIVSVEFECLYGVSHTAKSLLVDTAIFGGSNGYWRTAVLRYIHFCPDMMTEDIDTTLRALLEGHRIVHDPSIVATELAPVDLQSLWSQRKRWAQGWLEVTLKHQWSLLRSDKLDAWQKIYWTILLFYSVLFHFIALQVLPIIFSLALSNGSPPSFIDHHVWVVTLLTLLSAPYQTLVAMRMKNSITEYSFTDFMLYCLAIPFYCLLKNIIAITAAYDHLLGETKWVVTRRGLRAHYPRVMTASSTDSSPTWVRR